MQYVIAKNVINELNIGDINYAIVKGCPPAYYKTGQVGSRVSSDIDILMSRQDISRIENILALNDFKCIHQPDRKERIMLISNSHQIPSYSKKIGKLYSQIDVNFDLFWGEYTGKRIDVAEIYGCRVNSLLSEAILCA